jgi:hypothetical protein
LKKSSQDPEQEPLRDNSRERNSLQENTNKDKQKGSNSYMNALNSIKSKVGVFAKKAAEKTIELTEAAKEKSVEWSSKAKEAASKLKKKGILYFVFVYICH